MPDLVSFRNMYKKLLGTLHSRLRTTIVAPRPELRTSRTRHSVQNPGYCTQQASAQPEHSTVATPPIREVALNPKVPSPVKGQFGSGRVQKRAQTSSGLKRPLAKDGSRSIGLWVRRVQEEGMTI